MLLAGLVGLVAAWMVTPGWARSAGWSIVTSPNLTFPNYGPSERLRGVSCVSATWCEAVGDYIDFGYSYPGKTQTLIESWNGKRWTIQPSPNYGTNASNQNQLTSVSCVSARRCEAVGLYITNSFPSRIKTLIEVWNGKNWAIQPSPNNGAGYDYLDGVSCVAVTSCKAVGLVQRVGGDYTLIESWNGKQWTIQPSPYGSLAGVSCVSASWCEAVGGGAQGGGLGGGLIVSWNGKKWASQPSPYGALGLTGVSCVSATSCKAVGTQSAIPSVKTLVESWNGKKWTVQSSPNATAKGVNALLSVSCVAVTSCKAVGLEASKTLAESWNGRKWTLQPSPNAPAMGGNELAGVWCKATSCVAVGDYTVTANKTDWTLIESHR